MVSECASVLFNAADAAGMITQKISREYTNLSQLVTDFDICIFPKKFLHLHHERVKRPCLNVECQRLRLQFRCSKITGEGLIIWKTSNLKGI